MMLCEMLLSAGLVAAASCEQPDNGAAKAAAAALEPPVLFGAQSEQRDLPSGRKTGMTLADVTRDLEWRQAAFDRMAGSSMVEVEPAKPTLKTSF